MRSPLLRRCAVAVAALAFLAPALLAQAGPAAAEPATPAAEELASKYAPVVVLRDQDSPCDPEGEPFVPMAVDALLGNPTVALRQVGNGDPVIKWAPTAKDLYGLGDGVYLDFPGDSLQPGCTFAADAARFSEQSSPTVYAHVVRQPDRPGYLALQYWLFWYYNDWNDKHEGDWEFVQLLFRAASVEEALSRRPVSAGYAQHTGGELSDWQSDKLRREGSHPVVYSSERSHASYVEPALFLGRGASEGFGCDNTQAPSHRVRPDVVLLPDTPAGPDDPLAWLSFAGRWGERHASPNNGPTGPMSKDRWTAPVTWQEGLRDASFAVPGGSAAPPPVVGAFCEVVGRGSVVFINFVASPAKVLFGLLVVAALLSFLLHRTSWQVVPPTPVVRRRRAGEIARASVALYRAHPATFAALALVGLPIGLLGLMVGAVVRSLPVIGPFAEVAGDSGEGGRTVLPSLVVAAFWPLMLAAMSAAASALLDVEHGQRMSPRAAAQAVRARSRDLGSAFALAAVVVILLGLTAVALPIALWLTVRYQFLAQTTMLEGLGGRRALWRSAQLVRWRWLHTAVVAALVWAAVGGIPVLIGLLLLVTLTALPLWLVSVVIVLCQLAIMPVGATVMTLLYGDARAERDERIHAEEHVHAEAEAEV